MRFLVVFSPDFDRAHLVAPSLLSSTLVSHRLYLCFHLGILDLPPLGLRMFWFPMITFSICHLIFVRLLGKNFAQAFGNDDCPEHDGVLNPSMIVSLRL